MADERREPQDVRQEGQEYESPKAEELPADETAEVAPGAPLTQTDEQASDRDLKTGFADVHGGAVLETVRDLTIARD